MLNWPEDSDSNSKNAAAGTSVPQLVGRALISWEKVFDTISSVELGRNYAGMTMQSEPGQFPRRREALESADPAAGNPCSATPAAIACAEAASEWGRGGCVGSEGLNPVVLDIGFEADGKRTLHESSVRWLGLRRPNSPMGYTSAYTMSDLFTPLRLFGLPEEGFAIRTRAGRVVMGTTLPEKANHGKALYHAALRREHNELTPRRGPYGTCNCFGMVLANRRTAILDDKSVKQILVDDGYRVLASANDVLPGDVALWVDREGAYSHAAFVHKVEHPRDGIRLIGAISKWATDYGEDLHNVYFTITYDKENLRLEFWTDRPMEGA